MIDKRLKQSLRSNGVSTKDVVAAFNYRSNNSFYASHKRDVVLEGVDKLLNIARQHWGVDAKLEVESEQDQAEEQPEQGQKPEKPEEPGNTKEALQDVFPEF